MSVSPATSPPILRKTSCTARPMVALARAPWPKTLPRALRSSVFHDRAVDDDQRGRGVGRGLDAVELTVFVEQCLDRRQHDREIFRPAAGQHRVDGDLLDRRQAPARGNRTHGFVAERDRSPRSSAPLSAASGWRPAGRRSSRARRTAPDRPPARSPARRRGDGRSRRLRMRPWSAVRPGHRPPCRHVASPARARRCASDGEF